MESRLQLPLLVALSSSAVESKVSGRRMVGVLGGGRRRAPNGPDKMVAVRHCSMRKDAIEADRNIGCRFWEAASSTESA